MLDILKIKKDVNNNKITVSLDEWNNLNKKANELEKAVMIQIDNCVSKIKELEQHKLYYMCVEDASLDNINTASELIKLAQHKVQWTSPNILVLNKELRCLEKSEVKNILHEMELVENKLRTRRKEDLLKDLING